MTNKTDNEKLIADSNELIEFVHSRTCFGKDIAPHTAESLCKHNKAIAEALQAAQEELAQEKRKKDAFKNEMAFFASKLIEAETKLAEIREAAFSNESLALALLRIRETLNTTNAQPATQAKHTEQAVHDVWAAAHYGHDIKVRQAQEENK